MSLEGHFLLRQVLMAALGVSAGGVVAAGIFAFLAMIGIFPRLIGKSDTRRHIALYEMAIVAGGILGNLADIYDVRIGVGGPLVLGVFGFFVGVFVACLVMSLAEMLKTIPVFNRRIRLAVGLQYVVSAIAAGKLVGALVFFSKGIGR